MTLTLLAISLGTLNAAEYQRLSISEGLLKRESTENSLLIDVRTRAEYESGHIPDSINLPNESIDSSIVEILKDKEQPIFIYCRSGNRSKQAALKLAKAGYTNVYEIGGLNSYSGSLVK